MIERYFEKTMAVLLFNNAVLGWGLTQGKHPLTNNKMMNAVELAYCIRSVIGWIFPFTVATWSIKQV